MNENWQNMCRAMDEAFHARINLPESVIDELLPTAGDLLLGTSHFAENGIFDPIAAYGIEFGRREEDAGLPGISLKEYVERWPHKPEFFQYFERSNGYSNFAGILFRNQNIFVSLQWTTGQGLDSHYVNTLNNFLNSNQVQGEMHGKKAIIVYSEYRQEAYIATQDESLWASTQDLDRVLEPLPDGYGIFGNWTQHLGGDNESAWTICFEELAIANDYMNSSIQNSAYFLRECLGGYFKLHGPH